MRMRKHFATGAALAAAALVPDRVRRWQIDRRLGAQAALTAGVAYETTDYGPLPRHS